MRKSDRRPVSERGYSSAVASHHHHHHQAVSLAGLQVDGGRAKVLFYAFFCSLKFGHW